MALKGTFDVLSFPDLITTLAKTGATGQLVVRRRQGSLSVELKEGQLVRENGLETTFLELLEARGSFEFKPEVLNGSVTRTLPVDEVLDQARARLEEHRQFEAVLDLRPRPIAAPDVEKVTLSREQWRLVMAIDGRRSVRTVAKRLNREEQATCLLVQSLVQEGVLELVDPVRELVVKPAQITLPITLERTGQASGTGRGSDEGLPTALQSMLSLLRSSDAPPIEESKEDKPPAVDQPRVRAVVASVLGLVFGLAVIINRFRAVPGLALIVAVVMLALVCYEIVLEKQTQPGHSRPRSRLNWVAEFAIIIAVVLALDFVVESLVVKRYRTSSGSMIPTIQVGQQLLVDRLAPRFQRPNRGDLIIFNPPAGAAINTCGVDHPDDQPCPFPTSGRLATVFVKRVIGVPGDEVTVVGGRAYVNGKPQAEPSVPAAISCDICEMARPVIVPPGYFFVMGDNRDHSNDSRVWGPVPRDWIIGRVILSYWPITRLRVF